MTGDVHLSSTKRISSWEREIFLVSLPAWFLSLSLPPLFLFLPPSSSRAYLSSSLLRTESLLLALLDGDVAVAKWIRAHYRVSLNVAQSMEQHTLFTLPLDLPRLGRYTRVYVCVCARAISRKLH